jgi:hypothetical protein
MELILFFIIGWDGTFFNNNNFKIIKQKYHKNVKIYPLPHK